ncbi:MAG TPA: HNH endonuclease [Chloroflexota bacterium]|nr:HNH endonuclease [Chloroflexota bacterium]
MQNNAACGSCGVAFHIKPSKLLVGRGKYCTEACSRAARVGQKQSPGARKTGPKTTPLQERFWRHVDKSGKCWLWTAATNRGYGAFGLSPTRMMPAHRYSWELHNGPIPAGVLVCHKCDVRACVNPAHLFLGSHLDNTTDMVVKERVNSTLTTAQVGAIRARHAAGGVSQRTLAQEYGVGRSTLSSVINRLTWKHT